MQEHCLRLVVQVMAERDQTSSLTMRALRHCQISRSPGHFLESDAVLPVQHRGRQPDDLARDSYPRGVVGRLDGFV